MDNKNNPYLTQNKKQAAILKNNLENELVSLMKKNPVNFNQTYYEVYSDGTVKPISLKDLCAKSAELVIVHLPRIYIDGQSLWLRPTSPLKHSEDVLIKEFDSIEEAEKGLLLFQLSELLNKETIMFDSEIEAKKWYEENYKKG